MGVYIYMYMYTILLVNSTLWTYSLIDPLKKKTGQDILEMSMFLKYQNVGI